MSELRQRHIKKANLSEEIQEEKTSQVKGDISPNDDPPSIAPGSYWLTRIVFLRYLAFIYLTAFLVSYNQNKELIGNKGLTPARNFLLNGKKNINDICKILQQYFTMIL